MAPNTLAMKYLAFRDKGSAVRQVGRAYLVYLPVQIVSFLVLLISVRELHLDPLLGQLVAISVALVATYAGHKYLTFRPAREKQSQPLSTEYPESESIPRSFWSVSHLLVPGMFVAILVFRLAWVLLLDPHPLVKDAVLYDNAARWFLDSGTFAINASLNPSAWVVPGYSFFLSLVYWVFGLGLSSLTAVRIIQVILSVLTILVIYRVALRLQGRKVGIAFVVLAGLYPPFFLANEYLLTEVLYTFLLSLVVLFGFRLLEKASWRNALAFGVLLAVSAYVRPPAAIWGIVPFVLLLKKVPFRRVAAVSAVALIAFCLCLSPWWIRNARIYERFVPFTTNTGFTLVRGTYAMFDPANDRQFRDGMISRDELLTPTEELRANEYYTGLAVDRIGQQLREEPARFFYGRAKATADSFVTPTYPFSSLAGSHRTLAEGVKKACQVLQALVILLPAFLALWIRRRDRRLWLIAALPILNGLIYAAFFILPRYVFPVMPAILLLSSIGWVYLVDRGRSLRKCSRAAEKSSRDMQPTESA